MSTVEKCFVQRCCGMWTCVLLSSFLINPHSGVELNSVPLVAIKMMTGAWSDVKAQSCTVSLRALVPGDNFGCVMTADYDVRCVSATISDGSTASDFIGADNDLAVSDCIDAEIIADVTGAAEMDPRGLKITAATTTAKPFTALQSLHRRSAWITTVRAKGAEFAYFESFNDIDNDLMNSGRAKKQDKFEVYMHAK